MLLSSFCGLAGQYRPDGTEPRLDSLLIIEEYASARAVMHTALLDSTTRAAFRRRNWYINWFRALDEVAASDTTVLLSRIAASASRVDRYDPKDVGMPARELFDRASSPAYVADPRKQMSVYLLASFFRAKHINIEKERLQGLVVDAEQAYSEKDYGTAATILGTLSAEDKTTPAFEAQREQIEEVSSRIGGLLVPGEQAVQHPMSGGGVRKKWTFTLGGGLATSPGVFDGPSDLRLEGTEPPAIAGPFSKARTERGDPGYVAEAGATFWISQQVGLGIVVAGGSDRFTRTLIGENNGLPQARQYSVELTTRQYRVEGTATFSLTSDAGVRPFGSLGLGIVRAEQEQVDAGAFSLPYVNTSNYRATAATLFLEFGIGYLPAESSAFSCILYATSRHALAEQEILGATSFTLGVRVAAHLF